MVDKRMVNSKLAQLYRISRLKTGLEISRLNRLLAEQSYDPKPAQALLARYDHLTYPFTCKLGDAILEIDEGVFAPTLTSASPFLLSVVDFKPNKKMLDAFAGSGAFGINAALHGNKVVAFDISAKAVACAKKNAVLNNVSQLIDVRRGMLKECIKSNEKFDLITANPPLIPLQPKKGMQTALFDPGLKATKQFIAALPHLLTNKGQCFLITSDVIDRKGYECDIAKLCNDANLKMTIVAQLHRKYESYRIHKIEL